MTREEAVKLIDDRMCFGRGKWSDHHMPEKDAYWQAGQMAIKALEEPQWIPCSERLPEEHEWMGTKRFGTTISDEVYVTFENPKGERFCKHLSFQNGKLSSFDQSTIDAFYKGSKPIAWMPLPEAWRGDAE